MERATFTLDAYGNIYCSHGCDWKTKKCDYASFVPWPSARDEVLRYFTHDAELVVGDDLHRRCRETLGCAFNNYEDLHRSSKVALHTEKITELASLVATNERRRKTLHCDLRMYDSILRAVRSCKLLEMHVNEHDVQAARAEHVVLRAERKQLRRMLHLERSFQHV